MPRRLFDAFMFLNELDVLEIRLNELCPLVDQFILVESTRTHTGNPKPLVYQEHQDRFRAFPIHHVVMDRVIETADPWDREHAQRNIITQGLEEVGAKPDDLVIVADVDEIPSRKAVREGISILETMPGRRIAFRMAWFYYWLNAQNVAEVGLCPRMGTVGTVGRDPQGTRFWGPTPEDVVVQGGWHFGWLGDVANAQHKIRSFAHHEMNTPEMLSEAYLTSCFESGYLIHSRAKLTVRPVDGDYPNFVLDNLDRFARYIHPC